MASPRVSKQRRENPEDGHIYLETIDTSGKPITIFSTIPKLRSTAEMAAALDYYDTNRSSPEGFVVLPTGSTQARIRTGYEDINQPVQQQARKIAAVPNLPAPTETTNPILALTSRMINPLLSTVKAVTPQMAESVNTLGKAGVTTALTAAGPFLSPVNTTSGGVKALPFAANMLKSGIAGGAGYATGTALGGEDVSPGKVAVESGIAALGGGLASVTSYLLTRIAKGDVGEKVAKEVIDHFDKKFPHLSGTKNMLDIAATAPEQLSQYVQIMTKAPESMLKDTTTTVAKEITDTLLLTKGQQNTIRAATRRVVDAQKDQISKIDNAELFKEASIKTQEAIDGMYSTIRGFYNNKGVADTKVLVAEKALAHADVAFKEATDGLRVLYTMKEVGATEGWNPIKFAQRVRGEYQDTPGSSMETIGKILGQGQPLTRLPEAGQPDPTGESLRRGFNTIKEFLPFFNKIPDVRYKGSQVPWQAPELPRNIQIPLNIGVTQTGTNAMRSIYDSMGE